MTEKSWDDLFEIGMKELNKLKKASTGMLHYTFIDVEGKRNPRSGGCYAGVKHIKETNVPYAIFVDAAIHSYRPSYLGNIDLNIDYVQKTLIYLQWLLNDSMFAPAFITKVPEFVLNNGHLMDCKYPSEFIIAAGMAVRNIAYYPTLINNWYEWKDIIGPDAAAVVSHLFSRQNDSGYRLTPTMTWFNSDAYRAIKIVVEKKPLLDKLTPMSVRPSYGHLNQIFGENSPSPVKPYEQFPVPKPLIATINNSFGFAIRTDYTFYPVKTFPETLKELVKMHMEAA